jgi:uncharacterized protein YgiM (DUF1202 family)
MKNNFSCVLFLITIVVCGVPVSANAIHIKIKTEILTTSQDWMPCTVSDPTGTPLNVRSRANGKIIAKLKNGTLVEIDDSTAGNKWSRISFRSGRKRIIGWVLRDYLSCQ